MHIFNAYIMHIYAPSNAHRIPGGLGAPRRTAAAPHGLAARDRRRKVPEAKAPAVAATAALCLSQEVVPEGDELFRGQGHAELLEGRRQLRRVDSAVLERQPQEAHHSVQEEVSL